VSEMEELAKTLGPKTLPQVQHFFKGEKSESVDWMILTVIKKTFPHPAAY